ENALCRSGVPFCVVASSALATTAHSKSKSLAVCAVATLTLNSMQATAMRIFILMSGSLPRRDTIETNWVDGNFFTARVLLCGSPTTNLAGQSHFRPAFYCMRENFPPAYYHPERRGHLSRFLFYFPRWHLGQATWRDDTERNFRRAWRTCEDVGVDRALRRKSFPAPRRS